ncbi:hypothetical protein SARC_09334 [Sphaeroforma arctica JP610]|uniref:Uncharacterized protein n=1 Tax=Sphaeroforma arctica JP610 TaxID=667725 RepID=A0A0L0FN71_9EUKA|nr:hypothetical protein SARC_09334 [Sphaeroforma arctica JP610]KNC78222.1 hypothetical protein SARC_09334 [Sphaeroforma arctica JP610]|eukprot:XP_014152124.1 hypothetical protein SARC_09334 [Sphaeroforma arctica JP610]
MFPIPRLITPLKYYFQISVHPKSSHLLVPPMTLTIQASQHLSSVSVVWCGIGSPPTSVLDRIMTDNLVLLDILYSALSHSTALHRADPIRSTEVEWDDPATLSDTPSIEEFAHEQLLAKKNPHGAEVLKNVHDRLGINFCKQQQKKIYEQDASCATVYTPEKESPELPTPSPTPASIEASRQVLHARILKLSDELCQTIVDDNTARVDAL